MARFCGDLVGPTGKVTAIEADPDTAELLRMNADWWLLQNIRVLEVAVGADRGELTIWKNPYGNLGGNRAAPFPGDDAGSHVVERWPLDELLGADYPVDVVKVDVEGMDHEVIFGMREIYRRWHPAILAEFNVAAMRAMGTDPVGVLQAYQANGFAPRLLAADATMLSQLLKVNMAALLGPELLVAGHENEVVELVTRVDLVNLVM